MHLTSDALRRLSAAISHGLATFAAVALTASLASCGTFDGARQTSGVPGLAGGEGSASPDVSAVTFPDPTWAWLREGSFPRMEALRQVAPGVTKDQLYDLLGRPHFSEGLYGVSEWNYLFHFRMPAGIRTCQFQVGFDAGMQAQVLNWKPANCANLLRDERVALPLARPATQSPVVSVPAPRPSPATTMARRFELSSDALFGFGRSDLSPEGRRQLDEVLAQMHGGSAMTISITGHTDRLGSAASNERLSLARADSARNYLVQAGLPMRQIQTSGRGMSQPLVRCAQRARQALIDCLAPNRRVVIEMAGERA